MGAWNKSFLLRTLCYTVMLHAVFIENLQAQGANTSIQKGANATYDECRFGIFHSSTSTCECRNAICTGFGSDNLCMKRDNNKGRNFYNACEMLEFACKVKKKRLFYWEGACPPNRIYNGEAKDVTGEYCERDDHVNYCFNDGLCKFNEDGQKYCQCKKGYSGERCASRSILGTNTTGSSAPDRNIATTTQPPSSTNSSRRLPRSSDNREDRQLMHYSRSRRQARLRSRRMNRARKGGIMHILRGTSHRRRTRRAVPNGDPSFLNNVVVPKR